MKRFEFITLLLSPLVGCIPSKNQPKKKPKSRNSFADEKWLPSQGMYKLTQSQQVHRCDISVDDLREHMQTMK